MATTTKVAKSKQLSASKPPFLTPGQIMPEVLRAREMGCKLFFFHKEIQDEEKVKKVAWGMQDSIVQDWYQNNQEVFDAMTFKNFMSEVRTYWLPTDWSDTVRRRMLASVQGQRPFGEWAIDIQSQNTLLRGTPSHLVISLRTITLRISRKRSYANGSKRYDYWTRSVCTISHVRKRQLTMPYMSNALVQELISKQ
jgi:hypothetical protein